MPLTVCPKCNSTNIMPALPLLSQGSDEETLRVELNQPEPPNRSFIWHQDSKESEFKVSICGNCGYAEFYATAARELLAAYRQGYR
jgi:predicted nucleic-acid-binding Zn-ribbon protein